jgi:hypothetical protein
MEALICLAWMLFLSLPLPVDRPHKMPFLAVQPLLLVRPRSQYGAQPCLVAVTFIA